MPSPAERLAVLLEVHGDSYRSAGQLCGLDHTTLMRVGRGESENPATLAKIAEGYGVSLEWLRGERHPSTDFAFAVLSQPLRDRVLFLWEPAMRVGFALRFLVRHGSYTVGELAELLQVDTSVVESLAGQNKGNVPAQKLEELCKKAGLPFPWFQTGMVGREDEQELLQGMAEWALDSLADTLGLDVTEHELKAVARTLV